MEHRTLKQILYGSGYLLFIFLIIAGVYFVWLKPAPTCSDGRRNQNETGVDCGGVCASCEIKTLFPMETSWSRYFSAGSKTILAAEIKNPNSNYGANNFSYTFDVYNSSGEKIYTLTKDSFIYAGEIKYLVEAGVNINPENINKIEFSFSDPNWKSKDEFSKPEIQTREIKTEAAQPVSASGLAINNNAFNLSKINVIAFLFNKEGSRISVSKTELDNIKAFEEKFFRVAFPADISLTSETPPLPVADNFTRDLTIGSKGEDVKALQEFFKKQGFFEREPTDYFGQITKNALIQYQKKAEISPASGYFGAKTRTYINDILTKQSLLSSSSKFSATEADPSKTKVYVEAIR